jgi:hypothetical protein
MALPLAVAAVWGGNRLASVCRLGLSSLADLLARACIIALLLGLLLVPGQALHEQADLMTHSHALLAIHEHTLIDTGPTDGLLALVGEAAHSLSDGLQGQAVGLPLAFLALLWATRADRRRRLA